MLMSEWWCPNADELVSDGVLMLMSEWWCPNADEG